jgi:hypothetical protein
MTKPVAGAVALLAVPDASPITGATFDVGGGASTRSRPRVGDSYIGRWSTSRSQPLATR